MHRQHFCANGNLDVGIRCMQLEKTRQHLIIRHQLAIEVDLITSAHLNRDIIFLLVRRRRGCRRQTHPDAFHMGLAQAYHHETGEEEEHDIDQRDDLDPSSFVRNR